MPDMRYLEVKRAAVNRNGIINEKPYLLDVMFT